MKRFALYLLAASFPMLLSGVAIAQENGFESESHQWHKKAAKTCGMLKDLKTFDAQKMVSALADVDKEWTAITAKYLANPPKQYSADPLWKTYFEDLSDNVSLVRERVEKKQYRLAQKYCGQICMTFSTMHQTNGIPTLTDALLGLRMSLKSAQDMMNAGNIQGAKASLTNIAKMHDGIVQQLNLPANVRLIDLQKPVMAAYDEWIAAVTAGDAKVAQAALMKLMGVFSSLVMAS